MHILLELFFIHFPYSTDKENLFNYQEILEWVVISFILIALMFESVLIMYREIRCSSFIGLIDWKIEECSLSEIIGSKFKVEGSTRVTLYLIYLVFFQNILSKISFFLFWLTGSKFFLWWQKLHWKKHCFFFKLHSLHNQTSCHYSRYHKSMLSTQSCNLMRFCYDAVKPLTWPMFIL